ncbi:MAG: exodeoxyribonuclease V subunit alpha [Gammaproteobacteria bacterium]|nr:exodeoxyribonuclease V subunit alpha [Gammaproteobacteria bacterium]
MYKTFQECQKILDGVHSIDYFLARQLYQAVSREDQKQRDDLLFHSIMAASQALRNGHSCLKLDDEAEALYWHNPEENKTGYQFPAFDEWQEHLSASAISPAENHPLVYEQNRLYLRRYWHFEEQLGTAIRSLKEQCSPLDLTQGRRVIKQLFPQEHNLATNTDKRTELDWQEIAVANALGRQFTIIAGGPGTGKTFTVTKLLAALQILSENSLRIAMVAPTGKASQRLNESIQKAKSILQKKHLASDQTLQSIPDKASTLHRLLGVKAGSHNFRHNENKRLLFDVVLVDEISMIDLPLMSRLIRAVEQHCRIIMLGDADQLPSIAAGSVLADLAPRQAAGYSATNSQQLSELTGFDIPVSAQGHDYLTVLQKSHRFDDGGEIALLARQVIAGDAERGWDSLKRGKEQIQRVRSESMLPWLEQMAEQYYMPLFAAKEGAQTLTITQAFEQLNEFRFLAATRLGEQGVGQINDYIEQYLRSRGLITSQNEFYPGRPIMVTENHYHVGLYNGDTGLLWVNERGKLQAAFPQARQQNRRESDSPDSDSIRWLSLGRLPAVETVYAMTIHKTQGSEFAHVALILPQQDSPILSRELLYTAITRASCKLSVWADKSIWTLGVRRKVQRYSGLGWRVFGSG